MAAALKLAAFVPPAAIALSPISYAHAPMAPMSLIDGDSAMNELSQRVAKLREKFNNCSWPKISWRSLPDDTIDVWWNTGSAVDSSDILTTLLDALGGQLVTESARLDSKSGKPVLMFSIPERNLEIILVRHGSSPSLYLRKRGKWRLDEVNAICMAYELTYVPLMKTSSELDQLGVRIYQPNSKMDWSDLAGCEGIAQEIKTTVIDSTLHSDMFDEIMKLTRVRPESNKPKAVLFEGNPGTGKTSAAKIIASQSSLPMVFIPLQSIMSMYYGESEKTLAKIFDAVDKLGDTVIFMDEIDSVAPSRERDIHEASRRILSVLLQRIDGLESTKRNSLIIAATNRKKDLDPALLSRFDVVVRFDDPDVTQRAKIFARYAKHLTDDDRYHLALKSDNLTGRDIRDVCAHAERSWGSKMIQDRAALTTVTASAPPREVYEESLKARLSGLSF